MPGHSKQEQTKMQKSGGGKILSTVKGVVISAEDGMPVIGASIMVGGGQA